MNNIIVSYYQYKDQFQISNGIDGSAKSYNISYCNESLCSFYILNASICEGSCTHKINVSSTFNSATTNVTVSAINRLGKGSNSLPIIVGMTPNTHSLITV